MSYKILLKNRNYCLMQGANFVNRLGDSIDAIALSWLIYDLSKSPAMAAINFAINYLPTVLIQPFAGAFITKKSKKNIMVIADLARFFIVSFLGLMVLQGKATSMIVIFCTFLMSLFETLRLPAGNSILPLLISKEEYSVGVSFASSLSRITELVGTGMAGFIIGMLGLHFAILLDGISFLISGLLIMVIKIKENFDEKVLQASFKENFIFGIRYAIQNKVLLYIAIIACIVNMMLVPFNALLSPFVGIYYHGDASFLSIIGISISIGSILGGLLYPKLVDKVKTKTVLLTVFPTCSLFYALSLLCSYINNYYGTILAIIIVNFLLGINVGITSCYVSVLLMVKCEQAYLSRVSAFLSSFSAMFIPLLSLIVSVVSGYLDIGTIFIISAIIMLLISIIAYNNKELDCLND